MKPVKSKQQLRDELNQQISLYLEQGGDVTHHDLGESGRDANKPLPKAPFVEQGSKKRTLLNEVVKTIEDRKKNRNKKPRKTTPAIKERKQLLVDDFGEPLRWVWSDKNK